jgi:hypothetical protein
MSTSVYKMTVSELAKKRNEPVKEFMDQLNEKGFEVKSASKKLTQEDLNRIADLFNGVYTPPEIKVREERILKNPNVLLIQNDKASYTSMLVETKITEKGIELEVIESVNENSKGAALLEYKRLRGMNRVEDIF